MPKFSDHFVSSTSHKITWGSFLGGGGTFTTVKTGDLHSLREWWYTILRNYGKYACYTIFFVLSSDTEAAKFLYESGKELHLVSGKNCLIILLGLDFFSTTGLYGDAASKYTEDFWIEATSKHISEGESLEVAKLFDIDSTEFPGAIFFHDIRSSDYAFVSFADMKKDEINQELRKLFSIIDKQSTKPDGLMREIRSCATLNKAQRQGQGISNVASSFLNKTIENIIAAWVQSAIK